MDKKEPGLVDLLDLVIARVTECFRPVIDLRTKFVESGGTEEEFWNHFTSAANETFDRFLVEVTDDVEFVCDYLNARGWYVYDRWGVTTWREIRSELDKGITDERLDEQMGQLMRERVNEIRRELVRTYPQRAVILGSAFEAHQRGEYALSIPVFLAQAEGITLESTKALLYSKSRRRPVIGNVVETILKPTFRIMRLEFLS